MEEAPSTPPHGHAYENPWERAANDRLWDASAAAAAGTTSTTATPGDVSTTALLNGDSNHHRHHQQQQQQQTERSCSFQCFQACHVIDLVGGSAMVLYDVTQEWKVDRTPAIVVLTLAVLWIVRGALAKTTRCGVSVSATVSFALCLLYASLALCLWGMGLVEEDHSSCLLFPPSWCQRYMSQSQFALVLLAASVYEGIRYLWIRQWVWEESTRLRDDVTVNSSNEHEASASASASTIRRRLSIPWWWNPTSSRRLYNHNNTDSYNEPLLHSSGAPHWSNTGSRGYHMDAGVGSPVRQGRTTWWPSFFLGGGGEHRRSSQDDPTRDDASVEYASLNEDWASRSQEDPFWWTREEGRGGQGQGQR